MQNTENWKHIDFSKWCPKCVYFEDEESDPYGKCNDCLGEPARVNTQKPINFKEKSK